MLHVLSILSILYLLRYFPLNGPHIHCLLMSNSFIHHAFPFLFHTFTTFMPTTCPAAPEVLPFGYLNTPSTFSSFTLSLFTCIFLYLLPHYLSTFHVSSFSMTLHNGLVPLTCLQPTWHMLHLFNILSTSIQSMRLPVHHLKPFSSCVADRFLLRTIPFQHIYLFNYHHSHFSHSTTISYTILSSPTLVHYSHKIVYQVYHHAQSA